MKETRHFIARPQYLLLQELSQYIYYKNNKIQDIFLYISKTLTCQGAAIQALSMQRWQVVRCDCSRQVTKKVCFDDEIPAGGTYELNRRNMALLSKIYLE